MTLTLDLSPAEEERLAAAVRRAGVAPDMLLKKYVDSLPLTNSPIRRDEKFKGQKPLRGLGLFAHVPGGSDEYAQEKQREIDREDHSRE